MPHKEILDTILESITNDINKIVARQKETNGELDMKASEKLLEYGKYLRMDKTPDDEVDYSSLTTEEIDAEILKIVSNKGKK